MKNADMPAMPMHPNSNNQQWEARDLLNGYAEQCRPAFGLTKREMFAMHFHAALLTKYEHSAFVCDEAVREADALLEALAK